MVKAKIIEVDRTELILITQRIGAIEETIMGLTNKLDAMNKYYAQTITVTNEQMSFIRENTKKINEIYEQVCGKPTTTIELKAKKK